MKDTSIAVSLFLDREPEWTFSSGLFLNGLISLFRASDQKACRRAALTWLESAVSADGGFLPAAPVSPMDAAECGKALFFALDETGDERYQKALDALANRVKAAPPPDTPEGLYALAPFLTEYDTRFGSKQTYKEIAHRFKAVHQEMLDPEKGLYCKKDGLFSIRDEGFMLLALTDTAEKMDMQLYEHYRILADLLLEAVRLPYRKGTDQLFDIPGGDTERKPDYTGNIMTLSALLKGIRLGLLDEEKYRLKAMLELLYLEMCCEDVEVCHPGVWMLAQAEGKEARRC